MGKKLIFDYTFDASAKTVKVNDVYARKRFLLITNVTTGTIIYQFNDSALGLDNIAFDYSNFETTLTLTFDTTSMSDTDDLQILLEEESTDMTVNQRFVDPVSKIRVSNPENLIDTDFEYGLQSTKWETLELTNNIPTFFARNGDFDIDVETMTVSEDSNVVTVTTSDAHGLQRGAPIIIQSSGSASADGGFVVSSILSTTSFNYIAKSTFLQTRDIKETFTQLFPGSVYSGTEFKLTNVGGITTDSADPSELTVSTVFPTDFTNGTSMALSNTFAKSTLNFETSGVDVDNVSSLDISYTNNVATGETDGFLLGGVASISWQPDFTKTNGIYFEESDITVANNRATFSVPHGFSTGDLVSYLGDTSNTAISGLSYMNAYFVVVIDDNTLQFHTFRTTSTTSGRINISAAGTSAGLVKSAFVRSYWHSYYYGYVNSNFYYRGVAYLYVNSSYDNFDTNVYSKFGYTISQNPAFAVRINGLDNSYFDESTTITNPASSSNYDYYLRSRSSAYSGLTLIYRSSNSSQVYNYSNNTGDLAWVPALFDVTPSSLYVPSHGITEPSVVTVTATSGTLPTGLSSGTSYIARRLDDNRLTFTTITNSNVKFSSSGSADLVYRVEATLPNATGNTVQIPGNTLLEGSAVVYDIDGGTTIGGLSDGTTYYAAFKSGDRFKLSTTANPFGVAGVVLAQNSSFWISLGLNRIQIDGTNPFTTGDAVQYSSLSPIVGLNNGQIYWVEVSGSYIYLYNSKSDAIGGVSGNRVNLEYYGSGRGTFSELNIIDLTSVPSPSETQILLADYVGAADGNYVVSSTSADGLSFTFDAGNVIEARTTSVTAQAVFVADLNALYISNHGFISGDAVVYTTSGATNINGLTSGATYYVVRKNKDFVQFATTEDNASLGTVISLSETGSSSSELTGTVTLQPTTIVGSFNGQGAVSFTGGSTKLNGEGTSFTSYFNKGDTIFINIPETTEGPTTISGVNSSTDLFTATGHGLTTGDALRFTGDGAPGNINFANLYFANVASTDTFSVHYTKTDADANTNKVQLTSIGTNATVTGMTDAGSVHEATIEYVNSDGQITTGEALPATSQTSIDYLQNTSLLLRPDGFALHRPYDGGVELIPPTNPDSQMIRQTRKYFRYQSGKGIQVSFAVNFSPTSQIDRFTRSGDVGTIVTRFPHRLSADLSVFVSGSTNTNTDTLGTISLPVSVSTNLDNENKYYVNGEIPTTYTLYEGRTYKFDQSDSSNSGHPLRFSTTQDGTHGGGVEYTTGVTTVGTPGTAGAYTQIVVATDAPTLYTYCSVHSNMGFDVSTPVDPDNNQANLWNGLHQVISIVDDFTFTLQLDGTPSDVSAFGVVEYYVNSWENSSLRCGLFDDQNGIFFEFDGTDLYACRRSSIQQISGYVNVEFRSSAVSGINTQFSSQLDVGDYIVIKGQSHRVSKIESDELLYITPSYRGVGAQKVIITKSVTTRVPQYAWNLDVCDGTGYTGFKLDINKIQMAYIDYSWYGAGKVRFGFKDQHGDVQYVHSFVHGNFFTEAYMRSGNIPARYEIQNVGQPSYVPALAHWGTSVIMDGRFDADRAYVFNATSPNLTLLGQGASGAVTVDGKVEFSGIYRYYRSYRNYPQIGYAIRLDTANSSLASFGPGTAVAGDNISAGTKLANPISGNVFPYQPYLPSINSQQDNFNFSSTREARNLLVIDSVPTGTSGTSTTYTIGTAGDDINVTKRIPLISVRLAPSVDTSAPGFLGEREIINRMQLILNSVGILSTHAVTIELILNGQLSNNQWERVTAPSLSQLISHSSSDDIDSGASIYNFEAQGGAGTTDRQPELTTEALGEIATLGNAILGGDNVYPDGPDVLTVVATLNEDPSTVSTNNPFIISGRVSWSESQA
jgi:hypothetical protein